ncbi:MAG: cytochrome P450 [Pseudomonadota bacterium]
MPTSAALSHIPGPPAPPLVGHTLTIARDSYGTQTDFISRYGDVYKTRMLGVWRINLCGPDALEHVLMDRDKNFSSEGGWDALKRLYPGGLLLQDFDDHKINRRIMGAAFRANAIADYRLRMEAAIDALLRDWPIGEPFCFYSAIKDLTLRMGAAVFMGLPLDSPLTGKINRAIQAEIRAAVTLIRQPIPFTPMWRGVRGRRYLLGTFRGLIAERRKIGGEDFFSQMCIAVDDTGQSWSDAEILDQFNLLIMAAHDTTATTLSVILSLLATHPDWLARVEAEVAALPQAPLGDTELAGMTDTQNVLKEALRLVPPVPFIPRQALRDFHWQGYDIPSGSSISLNPGVTMLSPALFSNPKKFDPDRFATARVEDRSHKFAWTPFGGGAHKCIGIHFASMQVKLFLTSFMRAYQYTIPGSAPTWIRMPIPKPKGGLPVILESR